MTVMLYSQRQQSLSEIQVKYVATTMRLLRYLFGVLFLLLSLGQGALSYMLLFHFERPKIFRVGSTEIDIGYVFIGLAVVFLMLAIITLPFGARQGSKKQSSQLGNKKPQQLTTAEAKRQFKAERDLQRVSEPTDTSFEMSEEAGNILDEDVATYARLEDPQAMARLVAIEQREFSHAVVKQLYQEYYPKLAKLVDRIDDNDKTSLDSAGRHIIGIVRNKLKLTDNELSDNQFSIFQKNIYNGEQETFLQIYKPSDTSGLNDEQRSFVGKVVDNHAWESAQRRIRGKREDWLALTLLNAEELLA